VIKLELLLGVVTFGLWVYCLVDVIGSPEHRVRNLPKVAWLLLVLLFPFVGSIAWLAAGRPEGRARRARHEREQPAFPEYDRPGRAAAVDPQRDEEFLRRVRERAEEQRRRYEQSRRPRPPQPASPAQPDQSGSAGPVAEPAAPDEPEDPAAAGAAEH
jgi:hypothetical protein